MKAKVLPAHKRQQLKLLKRVTVLLTIALAVTPLLGRALAAIARSLSAHP
jgi:hypothetical protein